MLLQGKQVTRLSVNLARFVIVSLLQDIISFQSSEKRSSERRLPVSGMLPTMTFI